MDEEHDSKRHNVWPTMGLLSRIRTKGGDRRILTEAENLLHEAEVRAGQSPRNAEGRVGMRSMAQEALALLDRMEEGKGGNADHLALRRAQALFLLGRPQDALIPARQAAMARPYDVDSRIVLGRIRLALGDLVEAEHEHAAVMEEFGRDPDAITGQRAVALAGGALPLEEGLLTADCDAASDLLVAVWDVAKVLEDRVAALRSQHDGTEALSVIEAAVRRRGDEGK